MAKVHINSGQGAVGTGDLQLENGAPMDATLRPVTDAANTASPLELSTGLVAVTSTLQIATNDTEYIDAEDGSGNNRFTVSRASGSQVVNVDFASNPTSATDQVGAIRTYQDGVSLSDSMAFLRNGNVGFNSVEIRNFSAANESGAVLSVTSANSDTYNGAVYSVTGAVTIDIDNTVPDGFSMTIYQVDVNQATIAAAGTLTLRNRQGFDQTAGQYAIVSVVRIGSDLVLTGDTA